MPEYHAKDGVEDRHGEMTGAISVNMALSALPVTVWCVFIGPLVFGDNVLWTLVTGLAMGIVLPIVGLPISRRIWARLSAWADQQ